MQKNISFKVKGMLRDASESTFNPEFAYEIKNMRIMPTKDNTLMSLVNEKGNKHLSIEGIGDTIIGTPIGQAVIDDELVLFTAGDNNSMNVDGAESEIPNIILDEEEEVIDIKNILSNYEDIIYKFKFNNDTLEGKVLFNGSLGFNYKYPIESLSMYENPDLKKVYWTDALNPPRVINIAEKTISKWNNNSFNFVRTLKLEEKVTITKNLFTNGEFSSGVIQYAFTYYDKYNQESNIFYISPLYYISYNDRGGSPTDKINNSFNIQVSNIDKNFDYLRIYSIQRTSINATPLVKVVVDLSIPEYGTILNYTDTGNTGYTIDPTDLLYVGGEEVIFGTLVQKDNTLFLGNIEKKVYNISDKIKEKFRGGDVTFFAKTSMFAKKYLSMPEPYGSYPYNNSLSYSSKKITTFKYLEYYRFGVQFQHYTGKWSDPIYINDKRNEVHVDIGKFYNEEDIALVQAYYTFTNAEIIKELVSLGYRKVRPVIVYPTLSDRECICQGILCPTVYNVKDRYENSPFSQSSWYIRPNAPFDLYSIYYDKNNTKVEDWRRLDLCDTFDPLTSDSASIYSRAGVIALSNLGKPLELSDGNSFNPDIVNKGAWVSFIHNVGIGCNGQRNQEIQSFTGVYNPEFKYDQSASPYISSVALRNKSIEEVLSTKEDEWYVDQSIVTLHSPDIEFDPSLSNMDMSNLKLRIIGVVPITSNASDIDIQTSTTVNAFKKSSDLPLGFYKENIGTENGFSLPYADSIFGWKTMVNAPFWFDEQTNGTEENPDKLTTGFVVYPWHRNGSLNDTIYSSDKDGNSNYKSALLDKKRMSNLRYSYKTYYYDKGNIWTPTKGISDAQIFNSEEITLLRLKAPEESSIDYINYYGNIDRLITPGKDWQGNLGSYSIKGVGQANLKTDSKHSLFSKNDNTTNSMLCIYPSEGDIKFDATDPIRMKYKSTPHAVIVLNNIDSNTQYILPSTKEGGVSSNEVKNYFEINSAKKDTNNVANNTFLFWDKSQSLKYVQQDFIETPQGPISQCLSIQHGFLWLGELYNDNVKNRFGGTSDEALENNLWLPCGDSVALVDNNGQIKESLDIIWSEGDTYLQRYDHIKTYPFTLEDQNQLTEIVSFMCETRVNIDGRYDRNRGQISNFAMTPQNFNKVNEVYSQPNNFFTYRYVNTSKLNLNKFNNSFTWTKTKTIGELIDTWTNITLAGTIDLDGDKGKLRALRKFNNNIIAFQDRGISQVLYNENMQISSTEGVPIEIANSGKVTGKRYLSSSVGCANKWSICETPNGLYFIDDTSRGIYLFNGQLQNISDKFGFHSWINKAIDNTSDWNPVDFNNFITYYDKTEGDVLFIKKDECLGFSEPLGQFSSFYSYESLPYFAVLGDKKIDINRSKRDSKYKVWLHNGGDYNYFFDDYQPFYITYIANPDMQLDKTFSNIEFRADTWDKDGNILNSTFDTLDTWNEYQNGSLKLLFNKDTPSSLKRKFRIWRANIPRNTNSRARMRNPWLYIKMSMNNKNTNKTVLHDIMVNYFI